MLELLDLELLLFTDLIPSVPGSKPLSNILRLILNCNVREKKLYVDSCFSGLSILNI